MAQLLSFWLFPQIFYTVKSFWERRNWTTKTFPNNYVLPFCWLPAWHEGGRIRDWQFVLRDATVFRAGKGGQRLHSNGQTVKPPKMVTSGSKKKCFSLPTDVTLQNRQKALAAYINKFPLRRHLGQVSLIHMSKTRENHGWLWLDTVGD